MNDCDPQMSKKAHDIVHAKKQFDGRYLVGHNTKNKPHFHNFPVNPQKQQNSVRSLIKIFTMVE